MRTYEEGLRVDTHALGTASVNLTIGCPPGLIHHGLRGRLVMIWLYTTVAEVR